MLSIKKASTLASSRGNSAEANPRRQGNSILSPARWEAVPGVFSLTSGRPAGMVKAPKFSVRRSKRLSCPPRTGKSIAAYSACHAAGVFIGRFAHIGRNISDFQYPRGLAASQRAGESSLFSGLFAFNPQILCEVPHA